MQHPVFRYSFPTQILFGVGVRAQLADELAARKISRPIIVTDAMIAALPFAAEIQAIAGKNGADCALFPGRAGNPTESDVMAGVAAYKEHGADAIIALGGGAPMDVAKAIAVMTGHTGKLFDYEDEVEGALPIIPEKVPPILALPTTAGTGSEVGRSAVIAEDDTHFKRIIFSPAILPVVVFADPELTIGLPVGVTAATGMDALTHNVEARLARGFQPFCDGIAIEGMRLAAASLRDCVRFAREGTGATPEHLHARGLLLNASMMGAVAFQKGLGVTHSLAHSLSAVNDLHHGIANGIMISYAMQFNAGGDDATRAACVEMARAVRAPHESAEGFVEYLIQLKADVGMPVGLRESGVTNEHVDDLVRFAEMDGCHQLNPRSVSAEQFREMYVEAIKA